ncbi:MAG: MFS transporter [Candidatus Abyssobacteria bacterium SURF_5]|uniref:MFS transporter n=1 Tax=Abyssobacteria bacterium (strain SURF_5) TaxID=2093360 RepID=A0A3A4P272_ABYX5|nr:MAG: MFS transporter [Candidatus Abyssubacteria bacterium SURF_5]
MKKKIFYGWWIVAATNIICMLGYGTWLYCFGVFFKPMMNEFGWTRAMTAGAYSFRGIQGGFAAPVVGWATDKYGPRIVVFIGTIIAGFGFIMMYFVESLIGFYMVYGVLLSIGMSAMLYLPAMTAIANWFNRKRSRAMSILTLGAAIGGFICAPAAAYLIRFMGWRIAFVVLGLTVWVVALPLSLVIRHKPEEMGLRPDGDPPEEDPPNETLVRSVAGKPTTPAGRDWTLGQALASRTYWILALAFFLAAMTHAVVTVHAVPAITDMGINPEKAAFSLGLMTLLSIIGRLTFGWLGDMVEKRILFVLTYSFEAVGVLALMNVHSTATLYLFALLFGIGFGGEIPLNPAIRGQYFGRAAFGKIQGFMAPVTMMGSVIGPPVAGFLFDLTGSYRTAFFYVALLQFTAAIVIIFARPVKAPAAAQVPA